MALAEGDGDMVEKYPRSDELAEKASSLLGFNDRPTLNAGNPTTNYVRLSSSRLVIASYKASE